MSGYTIEVRTGIGTRQNILHTWLQITKPDGSVEAWGFYPQTDSFGNIIHGPGIVKPEATDKPYTATSDPMPMTSEQYNELMTYISAAPPEYSLLSICGTECSMWGINALQQIGLIPEIMSPGTINFPLLSALLYNPLGQTIGFKISNFISSFFTSAQNFVQRRDPLTFDLDGDGIETVAADANNPILFDYNADGIKIGTGWISPDDGFLVLDRNGNGTIDNGTELFGDDTPLYAGGTAADGFEAISQEDTNSDGVVNNLDANWDRLLKNAHMLCCVSSIGVATYAKNTSHFSGFARLASGPF